MAITVLEWLKRLLTTPLHWYRAYQGPSYREIASTKFDDTDVITIEVLGERLVEFGHEEAMKRIMGGGISRVKFLFHYRSAPRGPIFIGFTHLKGTPNGERRAERRRFLPWSENPNEVTRTRHEKKWAPVAEVAAWVLKTRMPKG